jgi:hypothetical protein
MLPRDIPLELDKLQFDYAWKWFSYHADQRVKMFNFMLIVFGIFATAIVSALGSKQQPWFTAILCFIGAALAAIFIGLDSRNERLLRLAEEVLTDLEKNAIFGEGRTIKDRNGADIRFGILSRQSFEDRNSSWAKRLLNHAVRHRFLLRLVGALMFWSFLIAGFWILIHPQ